jgi:hypothetical protein
MARPITAFLPYTGKEFTRRIVGQLRASDLVDRVYLLATGDTPAEIEGCQVLKVESLCAGKSICWVGEKSKSRYTLFVTHDTPVDFGQFALERFLSVADNTGAGLTYSDYYDIKEGKLVAHPVIDYQLGSIRDDFNFGSVLFFNSTVLRQAVEKDRKTDFKFAGLYSARLAISRKRPVSRIAECLYSKAEGVARKSGEKLFDYVDPRNRSVQVEMEIAATHHLKRIGAYLKPKFKKVNLDKGSFEYEASVIIPVKNRVKTIGDAVGSALNQKAEFPFNVIIVDNRSTDGTTEVLRSVASKDARVLHVIPQGEGLGIGGCWNQAVHHVKCGRFAVQLDSDDLYKEETALQRIVDTFRLERCAMVIGSYQMVNFNLEEIPPGVIDHREWTPENGRNNSLRINGLGAPRAFFTPTLRKINFPNVSYGEDYAVGLAVSREFQIGRIFEPIYLCRRWEGNSDAGLDIAKQNTFDFYKDKLRTVEIKARQKLVHESHE